jgi:serine/threonine-protein kinase RsbW
MERSFDRNFRALTAVFDFCERFSATHGFDESLKHMIDLLVEELFTNMVKHNTGGGPAIRIRMAMEEGRVSVELLDENVDPWDPAREPEVDLHRLIENRRAGGLGLHLVRSIADELRYDYKDRRMTVTAVKRLEK